MQRLLLTVILVSLGAATAMASPDRRTVYFRDPFLIGANKGEFISLERKLWGVVGMHNLWPLVFCPEESLYHCLYSDFFDFALSVPKRDLSPGATWRIGKFRFVVREVGISPFAGRALNATVIDTIVDGAPQNHARYRATYDPKYGLVCYASLNWKDPKTDQERPYEDIAGLRCAEDVGLWPREP